MATRVIYFLRACDANTAQHRRQLIFIWSKMPPTASSAVTARYFGLRLASASITPCLAGGVQQIAAVQRKCSSDLMFKQALQLFA
jgi:hypothetical protein